MAAVFNPSVLQPRSVAEVIEILSTHAQVLPIGGGTKSALARAPAGCTAFSMVEMTGIVDYDPGELTFTALAGTSLKKVAAELERHGQYLPFDPPFVDAGATVGGAIASGLNGPGRFRFGGTRDFILGVRFITGLGEEVRGGGKVVKNAAGFDLPKLLVGSLGRLGVIIEATFKVFPRPVAYATLCCACGDLAGALAACDRLRTGAFDFESLEILPATGTLAVRLGGSIDVMAERLAAVEKLAGFPSERLQCAAEIEYWRQMELRSPENAESLLVKVPLTLREIPELDRFLAASGASRRYGAGGNVAWIVWPHRVDALASALQERGLSGLVIAGPTTASPLIGVQGSPTFRARVKGALDPRNRFPDF